MHTGICGTMHFLVDFLCAWGLFARFQQGQYAYLYILIYNFCAFALQMPLGTLLDLCNSRKSSRLQPWFSWLWTGMGVGLTLLGTVTHPAVLGLGNALFHVGAGLDVIQEDFAKDRGGQLLGYFVAPGAVGLYLGTQLGLGSGSVWLPLLAELFLLVLLGLLARQRRNFAEDKIPGCKPVSGGNLRWLIVCCFAVVILRSWTGFAAGFTWKRGFLIGLLAAVAAALGKATGGWLAARFGMARMMVVTLVLAAICFLLGDIPVIGLAGLVLFNMSMPVTLYLLVCNLPHLPGFSFGLLTFGLFLGFLPIYFQLPVPLSGELAGALGSILSAALLLTVRKAVPHGKICA